MLIDTIQGSETFGGASPSSYKIAVFYRPHAGVAECPLHAMARSMHSNVRQHGTPTVVNASPNNVNNGRWESCRYEVPENCYIRIEYAFKSGGDVLYDVVQRVIRPRTGAALRRITLPLSGNGNLACAYFEGNFDIVLPALFPSLGLSYPDAGNTDSGNFAVEWVTPWISEEILERESSSFVAPSIINVEDPKTGEIRQVRKAPVRRLIGGKTK